MDSGDLENRFAFHAATTEEKRDAHALVRRNCKEVAETLDWLLPEGREKALAITKLEEAMFWANAALARKE